MRQGYIALTAGLVFGAMVALQPGDGIHSAYAAKDACSKNCKDFFKSCKSTVKDTTSVIKSSLSDRKKACKQQSDKGVRKACLDQTKADKKAAKAGKKAALKTCKADKKCRVAECKDLAELNGDESCVFSSPMEAYGDCLASLL